MDAAQLALMYDSDDDEDGDPWEDWPEWACPRYPPSLCAEFYKSLSRLGLTLRDYKTIRFHEHDIPRRRRQIGALEEHGEDFPGQTAELWTQLYHRIQLVSAVLHMLGELPAPFVHWWQWDSLRDKC